jgi:hypothetical protein
MKTIPNSKVLRRFGHPVDALSILSARNIMKSSLLLSFERLFATFQTPAVRYASWAIQMPAHLLTLLQRGIGTGLLVRYQFPLNALTSHFPKLSYTIWFALWK